MCGDEVVLASMLSRMLRSLTSAQLPWYQSDMPPSCTRGRLNDKITKRSLNSKKAIKAKTDKAEDMVHKKARTEAAKVLTAGVQVLAAEMAAVGSPAVPGLVTPTTAAAAVPVAAPQVISPGNAAAFGAALAGLSPAAAAIAVATVAGLPADALN